MELGPIKDELNAVKQRMETVDQASSAYEELVKRYNELRKMILDEEKRRDEYDIEMKKLEIEKSKVFQDDGYKERELDEKKKDRRSKIALGIMLGMTTLVSIFSEDIRVIGKQAENSLAALRKMIL